MLTFWILKGCYVLYGQKKLILTIKIAFNSIWIPNIKESKNKKKKKFKNAKDKWYASENMKRNESFGDHIKNYNKPSVD